MNINPDKLLHEVHWQDLLNQSRFEIAHEQLLSLPWLVGSLWAAHEGFLLFALASSFMFFLTGLRQVHNAFHHALGLPRWAGSTMMFVLSVLMLGSMHAVQINHLRHHRHCMAEDDVEAMGARLSGWGALMLGPRYPWMLHVKAFELASPAQRRWIIAELMANLVWLVAVFEFLDIAALKYHVIAMAAGQCCTAFFAVWTTHNGCEAGHPVARSIRNRFKAAITYNMFYHFEHHMFPAVPTCKLPELATRLDRHCPELGLPKVY